MFSKVPIQEQLDFLRNLSLMLKSGITLNNALKTLADQTKSKSFQKILTEARKDIETGTSLSEALSREERTFGKVFLGLIRSGEASGTLESNLGFLAGLLEQSNEIRRDVNNALLYPKIVFSATIALGTFLAVIVFPKLTPFFSSFNIELPLPTRMLLFISNFVQNYWHVTVVGIIAIIILFVALNRVRQFKRITQYISISLPFFGELIKDYQLSLISRLFFVLFKSGMPVAEVLALSAEAVPNIRYKEALAHVQQRIIMGTTITQALSEYPHFFPKSFLSIIDTGEKSGTLTETFQYLTKFYAREVRHKIKKLPVVVEPLMLIMISLVVGFIALAIIMPIYSLTGTIGDR